MEVLFCSTTFFFDPLLALGDAAMRCASWGFFSLVTSFYGNDHIAQPALPTAEERAEMRALDAKLDALAAKLKG